MKCPKCGYLGFETSERCRNCGYDFSLTVATPTPELPLHASEGAGAPLADFEFARRDAPAVDVAARLDLDRIIGADPVEPTANVSARVTKRPTRAHASAHGAGASQGSSAARPDASADNAQVLPLFPGRDEDAPLITAPRPARAPLSVRRTTPEIPRSRLRPVTPRPDDGELALLPEHDSNTAPLTVHDDRTASATNVAPAAAGRRLLAAVIDIVLLTSINAGVLYLTLALSGLTMNDVRVLPFIPLVAFFAILDGGYLVGFIAASGQTVGKMVTGIRVMRDDGQRVDIAGALLRAVGCALSLMTVGAGYVPAFVTADRRALQDRIAGTRVVSAR